MKLFQRYKKLNCWNKLYVWAAIVTLISFLICNKFNITIYQSSSEITKNEITNDDRKKNKTILNMKDVLEDKKYSNNFTFSFVNQFNNSLVSKIEEITKYRYSKNSNKNKIEIIYSGEIKQIRNSDLYYYPGGVLIILIDGKICCRLDSIIIEKTLPAGNPYDVLQSKIESRLKNQIKNNTNLIAIKIKECF